MAARGELYWGVVDSVLYINNVQDATYAKTKYTQTSTATSAPWSSLTTYTRVIFGSNYLSVFNCIGWFKNRTKLTGVGPDLNEGQSDAPQGFGYGHIVNCTSTKEMFSGCTALTFISGIDFDEYNVNHYADSLIEDMSYMFYNCQKLIYYSLFDGAFSDRDTPKLTNLSYMFNNCYVLDDFYGVSNLNTVNVTNTSYMFANCMAMSYVGMSYRSDINTDRWNTKNITNMSYMFSGCTSIGTSSDPDFIDDAVWAECKDWDTSNVTTMASMFAGCTEMRNLDIANFDITKLTTATSMFNGCSNLKHIYIKGSANWAASSLLANSNTMFTGCTQLVGGNGTPYSSSYVNKSYARVDKSGTPGYFTGLTYTIRSYITGNGSISFSPAKTGNIYDYGDIVNITVSPNSGQYIKRIEAIEDGDTYWYNPYIDIYYNGASINSRTYAARIIAKMAIYATFNIRNTYQLTVTQSGTDYDVQGQGSYMYLDNPTLILDLNEASIAFLGWYADNKLISKSNPYTFTMPDKNYTLEAKFEENPFSDEKVRQFVLQNGNGEVYKLTSKDSDLFLVQPRGLGYKKQLSTVRYGNSVYVEEEEFEMPKPNGTLYFHNSDMSENYRDYHNFVRFTLKKPFTLWYKVPYLDSISLRNTYHIPVEITSLEKSETDEHGAIISGIEFQGTEFWRHTLFENETTGYDYSVTNNGDLDTGFELDVSKADNTQFTNPVITFKQKNLDGSLSEYGIFGLEGTYTRIKLNTKDSQQNIDLWNGETQIQDPFKYLNFSLSDGNKYFPYPKLKAGLETRIEFSYDNMEASDRKNYVIVFDEEYVSV